MCCLFGLYDYGGTLSAKQKNRMIAALAAASEVRGIDATGIAYCMNGHLSVYKRPLPADAVPHPGTGCCRDGTYPHDNAGLGIPEL